MTKYLVVLLALFLTSCLAQEEPNNNLLVSQLTKSSSDFSQRLYQQVATGQDNAVYSPYSIHSALSMTSVGARGDTLTEMRKVLGTTAQGNDVGIAYHKLNFQLHSALNVRLNTANSLFVNPNLKMERDFVAKTTLDYFALVTNFDLQADGGPEKAINDYVAEMTEDMIKDVLDKGTIDATTAMLLVNTIFFNGTWQTQFDEYLTKKQDFHQLGGAKTEVDMMNNRALRVPYKRDAGRKADVMDLPFKGKRFSMTFVLPHDAEGITDLEKTLTANGVDDLFKDLESTRVKVAIPKFKIESKIDLKPILVAIGMTKAFSEKMADFSGISKQGSFVIDKVIHQASIDVNEKGTVASAATVVSITAKSAFLPPEIQFIADHPFMFFLRDSQTGQILFQGKFSA